MKVDVIKAQITAQLTRIDRQKKALEHRIQTLQQKTLTALPRQVGLPNVDSLILALTPYATAALRARLGALAMTGDASGTNGHDPEGRTPRARFTEEMRVRIRRELEQGQKSVAQISREYGPSHPTIMGWKREWGMTRPRPRRAATAARP